MQPGSGQPDDGERRRRHSADGRANEGADELFIPGFEETAPSDAELITAVRGGDRTAFGELYRRHVASATALARQFSHSGAEADDLVSESFARVLDTLLDGRGPDSAFRAYLFTSIRNTAIDRGRKDKRLQFTDDLAPYETVDEHLDPVLMQMENSFVAKAFAQLPERWRTVLWHTQVEGQSAAEVGLLLGMAPNAVSSLTFRAREGLREAYLQVHMAETMAEGCRTTINRLGAWTRGGLSKREHAQVDAHLETCDTCPALAAELSEINTGLRALLAPILLGTAAAGYVASLPPVAALTRVGSDIAAGQAAAGGQTPVGSGPGSGSAAGQGFALARLAGKPGIVVGGLVAAAVATILAITLANNGSSDNNALVPPATPVTAAGPNIPTDGAPLSTGPAGTGPVVAPPATETSAAETASRPTVSALLTTPVPTTPVLTTPVLTTPVLTTPVLTTPVGTTPPIPFVPAPDTSSAVTPPTDTPVVSSPDTSASPSTSASPESPGPSTRPTSTSSSPSTPTSTSPTSRPPTSEPPTTEPPTTEPPTPAAIVFGEPSLAPGGLVAGGTSSITMPLSNDGQTASDAGALDLNLPAGVTVAGANLASSTPALRGATSAFADASNPRATAIECTPVKTGETCAVPAIPAGAAGTLTIQLAVAPDAADGTVQLTFGTVASNPLTVTVGPGYASIALTATGTIVGGQDNQLTLAALPVDGVTNPGVLTLPTDLGNGFSIFGVVSGGCAIDATAPVLSCTPDPTGRVLAVVNILAMPSAIAGPGSTSAGLPGARTFPVTLGSGSGLAFQPRVATDNILITGRFSASAIGAATHACLNSTDTRGSCADAGTFKAYGDPSEAEPTFAVPERTVVVPAGATLVNASLAWAATAPGPGGSLGTVTLNVGGTPSTVSGSSVPKVGGGTIEMRTADVTGLLAGLTADTTITVTDLDASLVTVGNTPMGAWTLTLIWSDPSAPVNSVALTNAGTSSTSTGSDLVLAPAGNAVSALFLTLWAPDGTGWAVKQVRVGAGSQTAGASIDEHSRANGYSLTALDPALLTGSAGQPVLFRNGPTSSGFDNDQLWIGPVLVVRAAS